jgi:hypothetical protein
VILHHLRRDISPTRELAEGYELYDVSLGNLAARSQQTVVRVQFDHCCTQKRIHHRTSTTAYTTLCLGTLFTSIMQEHMLYDIDNCAVERKKQNQQLSTVEIGVPDANNNDCHGQARGLQYKINAILRSLLHKQN